MFAERIHFVTATNLAQPTRVSQRLTLFKKFFPPILRATWDLKFIKCYNLTLNAEFDKKNKYRD